MMFAPLASVFQFGSVLEWVSHAMLGLMAFARVRSMRPEQEPLEELTFRLRHPWRYAAAHPLKAIRRGIRIKP